MRLDLYMGQEVVGFMELTRTDKAVYLVWTHINPEHRSNGYSTRAVGLLVEQARSKGQRVYIDFVLRQRGESPYVTTQTAKDFYGRLGFVEMFSYGEDNTCARMASSLPDDMEGRILVPEEARLYLLEQEEDKHSDGSMV